MEEPWPGEEMEQELILKQMDSWEMGQQQIEQRQFLLQVVILDLGKQLINLYKE